MQIRRDTAHSPSRRSSLKNRFLGFSRNSEFRRGIRYTLKSQLVIARYRFFAFSISISERFSTRGTIDAQADVKILGLSGWVIFAEGRRKQFPRRFQISQLHFFSNERYFASEHRYLATATSIPYNRFLRHAR